MSGREKVLPTTRAAKEYLAGRIAAEAEREGAPLTEVERKMLYFSETDWTLPGIYDVNAEFERDYDEEAYEAKILRLALQIQARDAANDPQAQQAWDDAVGQLAEGDNYLTILLDPSFAPDAATARPPHDRLKLWLTAFAVVLGTFGLLALLDWIFGPKLWGFGQGLSAGTGSGLPGLLLLAVIVMVWWMRPRFAAAWKRLLHRKPPGAHLR